jgi:asparagine synthase (glutamine-hydrolysing)
LCGIAGVVAATLNRATREALVQRMIQTLRHRGPDAQRVLSEGAVTFGVARLSIVDRATGSQPMSVDVARRRYSIAYNGEVYNFLELRAALGGEGIALRTRSDTETVLAAHARWGLDAVDRLDGMFAYAVWDSGSSELFLVRDRLGIKPLFYLDGGEMLFFASEPKALLSLPQLNRTPDPAAILEYFLHGSAFAAGYVTGERSFFESIRALPPGHVLRWAPGRLRIHRFWSPLQELGPTLATKELAEKEIAEAVRESVQSMLMGEVPVGTALSGGLDSSLLTAEAARATDRLTSACITYDPHFADPDARHATLLSQWLNREQTGCHHLEYTYISGDRYLAALDEMVQAFDEPHWELRQLAMFENYRTLARAGQTVVLTGEGADELFFGYYHKFPGFKFPVLSSPEDFARFWRQRVPWVQALMAPAFRAKRVSTDLADHLIDRAVRSYLEPCWSATQSQLRAVQCWYLQTFLPWLLMVNDRCSMAHGVEGRFPYLSRQMVALALRIPQEWNIAEDGLMREKVCLRQAARDRLPVEIWRDRAKSPLPVPIAAHYHECIATRLASEMAQASPEVWEWLDRNAVEKMVADFTVLARTMRRSEGETLTAYIPLGRPLQVRTAHLFAVLSFLRWYQLYYDKSGGRSYESRAVTT